MSLLRRCGTAALAAVAAAAIASPSGGFQYTTDLGWGKGEPNPNFRGTRYEFGYPAPWLAVTHVINGAQGIDRWTVRPANPVLPLACAAVVFGSVWPRRGKWVVVGVTGVCASWLFWGLAGRKLAEGETVDLFAAGATVAGIALGAAAVWWPAPTTEPEE